MTFLGRSLIGTSDAAASGQSFHAMNPATGTELPEPFYIATPEDIDRAASLAAEAFPVYAATSPTERAAFLRAIADEMEASRSDIAARVPLETALPEGRANGELGRTIGQLRMFADLVEEGSWVDARLETALPDRAPVPKPDLRSMRIPIGPVAVFGASNFPLAFSVAGGDTASALASGCPVVCVAHYAHPGVSELAGRAIRRAVASSGLPEGVFSMLQGTGQEVGVPLVDHPAIKAVGFTGSRFGGLALARRAADRPEPIPVFAEMSSINPIVVLKGALSQRSDALAQGLAGSVSMGIGQFCTNPGVVLVPAGDEGEAFSASFAAQMDASKGGTALHAGIARAYDEATRGRTARADVDTIASTDNELITSRINPWVFRTTAAALLSDQDLASEAFGPSTTLVTYRDDQELYRVLYSLEGQLTTTIQCADSDLPLNSALVHALQQRSGRLIINGFPTGVEVCQAMVHGGPYPATTDGRTTSVGTAAIERFTRPFCFQDMPHAALPAALQDGNPLGIWRLVDGKRVNA
ncbi:MAG: aldehyde dehydrogenase (NADP(+)) [Proteobacteria bacterium]|nr:aldehyde dehydrogenase (NADP(+)) [Pseudomonadota bacterium]